MPVVKCVNILSVARIGALFGIVMGLVWGAFFGTIAAARMGRFVPGLGAIRGVALIVIMPVIGVIAGFIGGAIHAFLYNMFAGWVGGITLEFQQQLQVNHLPIRVGLTSGYIVNRGFLTFTPRLTRIHIHESPVIMHGALQLLCDLPSLQPCMGIFWLPGRQPPEDSQTCQGTMPAMP